MVTVLFTDLVDSTGLAQRFDAERARDLLGRFFDAASEELIALRGRPEKFIGDAVMAVFGLPHVHEDDALRAVRAGLAIRERVRRLGESLGMVPPLEVRTGIETGEAAVGRSPTGQLLVTGPVVNTAARLQAAAQVGQVLVGQTTYLLTKASVAYGRPRRVRAKGFDVGLEAYGVEDLPPRSARRTIPVVGRAGEQAILGQSLGVASTTGRPVLVTVAGEAGIGKSRLADELAAGVSAAVLILRGQAQAHTDTATFSPAAAIVGDVAGIRARDDPEVIRGRLRELAERTSGDGAAARLTQRLSLLFGLTESRDETAFVPEVQAGFISVIDGLARDHPVLLIFEDVHTLKAPMLDLIERLGVHGQGPRRALIVALARGELLEDRPAWGAVGGNSVLIRLEALSRDESVQLEDCEVVVRDPQPGDPQRWRLRHSTLKDVVYASLPKRERLRLHELVAGYLQAAGHPSLAADHLELAAFAAIDLDPNDRSVPDRAADALLVAGDRARRRMESRTAIDRYERSLALAGAEERWQVREARVLAGKGESHYWLGEYSAATLALTRAVELGEEHDDAFALALALRFLGDVAINFEADVDKAERLLQRSVAAAERLGDPWPMVRSLVFAGWVPWTRERYDEAEKIWRRALETADPRDHWARVRALTALSINHSEMEDREAALKLIDEAGALAEESGDRFSVGNTAVQKARALDDLGRGEEALPWFDRGVAIFSELGARWEIADARAARGIAKRNLSRLDEAEEDLRAAIRIAEELGDRQLPPWTLRNLAKVAELRGDKVAAEELLKRSKDAESRGPH